MALIPTHKIEMINIFITSQCLENSVDDVITLGSQVTLTHERSVNLIIYIKQP